MHYINKDIPKTKKTDVSEENKNARDTSKKSKRESRKIKKQLQIKKSLELILEATEQLRENRKVETRPKSVRTKITRLINKAIRELLLTKKKYA